MIRHARSLLRNYAMISSPTLVARRLAGVDRENGMSRLYGPHHRALQDRFDMRRLADGIEQRNVRSEISPQHKEFI